MWVDRQIAAFAQAQNPQKIEVSPTNTQCVGSTRATSDSENGHLQYESRQILPLSRSILIDGPRKEIF